jgi:hypothetical protein
MSKKILSLGGAVFNSQVVKANMLLILFSFVICPMRAWSATTEVSLHNLMGNLPIGEGSAKIQHIDLGGPIGQVVKASIKLRGRFMTGTYELMDYPGEEQVLSGTFKISFPEPENGYWEVKKNFDISIDLNEVIEFKWYGQGEPSWNFLEDGQAQVKAYLDVFVHTHMENVDKPSADIWEALLIIETAPTGLTVTSPNGGEIWQPGIPYNITWTSNSNVGSDVKIELYKGVIFDHTIIDPTPNDGSYNWSIPATQTIGLDYTLKITSTSIPTFFDESDDYFSINGVIFEDSFPPPMINRDKWTVVNGAKVDNVGTNEPSPEYSLHLNGHSSFGDLIESRVIDLSSYSSATLTYYYQRTGLNGNSPEAGEDLIIEYYDGSSWVELNFHSAIGPNMTDYYDSNILLPSDALHSEFRLRLQRDVGRLDSYGDWFVDDVKIIVEPVSLVAWGANNNGQCDVPTGNQYVAISAGCFHSLALKSDGSIVAWGSDQHGQPTPPPPVGNDFIAIAAGLVSSLALKSDGSIVAWGIDQYGQKATAPVGKDFEAIAAGSLYSLALKSDGSIVAWGDDQYGQASPPPDTNFVAIAAGSIQSLALKSNGSLVGWGVQATPPAGYDFEAISAGSSFHSLALKNNGSLMGWGDNSYGQATPPPDTNFVAIAAGSLHSLALKSDGSIVGWGSNMYGQATPPVDKNFISIDAGYYHSLAISRVSTKYGQRSNLVFCRGGKCAPLYSAPAAPASYIGSMAFPNTANFATTYSTEVELISPSGGTWTAWVEPEILDFGITGRLWIRGENLDLEKLPNDSGEIQVAEVHMSVKPAF